MVTVVVVVVYCCELRRHFTSLTSRRSLSAVQFKMMSKNVSAHTIFNVEKWDERGMTKPEWKSDCRNTTDEHHHEFVRSQRERLKIIVREMCGFEWHKKCFFKESGNDNPLLKSITFISFCVFHVFFFVFLPQADKENYCELLTTVKWETKKKRNKLTDIHQKVLSFFAGLLSTKNKVSSS